MLSKQHRLTKTTDFDRVFREGVGARRGGLNARAARNDLGVSRFGVVVSKKVSKKAVDRNRIKRQLTEAIRQTIDDVAEGFDIVLVVSPGFHAEVRDIPGLLQDLWKNMRIQTHSSVGSRG